MARARWWWDDRNYYLAVQRTNLCCVPLMCRKVIQQPSFVLQYPHQPFIYTRYNLTIRPLCYDNSKTTFFILKVFTYISPAKANDKLQWEVWGGIFCPSDKSAKREKITCLCLKRFPALVSSLVYWHGKEHTDSITDDIYTPMGSLIEYT